MSKLNSANKLPSIWVVAIGIIAAWILLAMFGSKYTLACSRSSEKKSECIITDYGLFAIDRSVIVPIKDIKTVDIVADSDEEDTLALLVLLTNANVQVEIGTAGSYEEKDRIAQQIAWFLENPTSTTFNFTEGNQTFAWCLLTVFSLLLLNYLVQLIKSILDRSRSV
jgi:hypothetical protein